MICSKADNFQVFYEGEQKQFEGIMAHLSDIIGQNPALNGVIEIKTPTQTHEEYLPHNLIEYGKSLEKSYWNFACYDPQADENWILFDFKKNHKIIITAYTIRCGGSSHPKSWKIEGSNDQNVWTVIDEIQNCSILNRPRATHTFLTDDKDNNPDIKLGFSYIRFVQLENMSPKRERKYRINLKAIEFFGYYNTINE